jgi:PAS domain S-box-containing protein
MLERFADLIVGWAPGRKPVTAARRRRVWIEKAVAGIDEALVATDVDGRITFLNAAAETLTGWPFDKAVGRPLDEVVPLFEKATHARVTSPLAVLEHQGDQATWIRHTVLAARDGRSVPIDYRGAWIRGENARTDGAVFLIRDASVRNQVEEAMERMAAIVEHSEDAIVGIALDGAIMTWNAAAERLYGYTADEIVGRPLALLFPPEQQQEQSWIWDLIRRGERIPHYETRCMSKSGPLDVSVSISPIKEADGRIVGFSSIARDMSVRRRVEEEQRRTELLRRLADAQEQERRRISRELHDQLGQQLTALKLGLEAVHGGEDVDQRREELLDIVRRINQDVRRIALELRPTTLDDLGLQTALLHYVEDWSERSNVEVDLHVTGLDRDRLPPAMETNLYRIAQEALTNVLKHARAAHVTLILERRADHLLMIVEDDGGGFDPEALPRDRVPSEPCLGLSGMRERVEAVGGSLQVESALGAGTTLFVRVPFPTASAAHE